jgi:exodeoxyribonuclease III
MFLVSWNVAAWTTTTTAIRGAFGSLEAFFERLGADILCLQETKVGKKRLDTNEVASGAADRPGFPIAGYESFWSYCTDKGMNGVCTFVKSGLTYRVDAKPLGDDALDGEGRCIATYHSHFTLFNVYVPNSRGGERQAFKLRFLAALKAAMDRARKDTNRPVILVGDMNVTYRTEDCHFSNRKICLLSLSAALRAAADTREGASPLFADLSYSKRQPLSSYEVEMLLKFVPLLQEHVVQKLSRPVYEQTDGVSGPNDQPVQRLRAAADRVDALREALREAHSSQVSGGPASATDRRVTGDGGADDDDDHRNGVGAMDENGGASAFRDYVWIDSLIRGSPNAINDRNETIFMASECVGVPCHARADAEFALSLLTDPINPMVDTFAEFCESAAPCLKRLNQLRIPGCPRHHPPQGDEGAIECAHDDGVVSSYPQPFTCWDQYRNKRYDNEGNRIDYIFVDASLLLGYAPPPTQPCGLPREGVSDSTSHSASERLREIALAGFNGSERRAGLARATANGRYSAAPTSGGGMEKLRNVDKLLMFNNAAVRASSSSSDLLSAQSPHRTTGLLITPPQFSDHIAVTLVLAPLDASAGPSANPQHHSFLLPRDAGKAVIDPSGVLFRRKSGNLMSMFARVAAVKASIGPVSLCSATAVPPISPPVDSLVPSSAATSASIETSRRKRDRESASRDDDAPGPRKQRDVDVVIIDD